MSYGHLILMVIVVMMVPLLLLKLFAVKKEKEKEMNKLLTNNKKINKKHVYAGVFMKPKKFLPQMHRQLKKMIKIIATH